MNTQLCNDLLIDATVGLLSADDVEAAIEAADPGGSDPHARVKAMVRTVAELSARTLPLGRSLIRLTVEAPTSDSEAPKRGYRRVAWVERALDPLRSQLPVSEFDRLVSAVAMVVGWEALVVLGDLRGLDAQQQVAVSSWAARALVEAALAAAAGVALR